MLSQKIQTSPRPPKNPHCASPLHLRACTAAGLYVMAKQRKEEDKDRFPSVGRSFGAHHALTAIKPSGCTSRKKKKKEAPEVLPDRASSRSDSPTNGVNLDFPPKFRQQACKSPFTGTATINLFYAATQTHLLIRRTPEMLRDVQCVVSKQPIDPQDGALMSL